MAKKVIDQLISIFLRTGRDEVEENISYLELGGTKARTIVEEYQEVLNQAKTSTEINAFRVLSVLTFLTIMLTFGKIKIILGAMALMTTFSDESVESALYMLMMISSSSVISVISSLMRFIITFTKYKHFNILIDIFSFAILTISI